MYRRDGKPEIKAEMSTLSIEKDDDRVNVIVKPGLSVDQMRAFYSTINEAIERNMILWLEQPDRVESRLQGDDIKASTLGFPRAPHFGIYHRIHAENGLRIVYGILEQDGVVFDMDGMGDDVKDLITPAPNSQ